MAGDVVVEDASSIGSGAGGSSTRPMVSISRRTANSGGTAVPAALAIIVYGVWLLADRFLRFYQGDSLSYYSTGLNGWIPPDRSWAYGFAGRWLVIASHSLAALVIVQALLMLGAVLLTIQVYGAGKIYSAGANPPWKRIAIIAFALLASADPLNQAYIRFWLSDAPAAAAFVAFVVLVSSLASSRAPVARLLPAISGCVVFSIFVRVAYAPIEITTLFIASACVTGSDQRKLRRRLLPLAALPILALGALAAANTRVAIPSLRGEFFVNRMSGLYTMGVFLPALRQEDFARAGVPLTKAEFDVLDLGDYGAREMQIWADGPQYVRWLMQQKLGVDQVYDARFQATCAAVVHSALLHHPQTMVATYLVSLAIQFAPSRWNASFGAEMGFGKELPGWAAKDLTAITGRTVSPWITKQPSAATAILGKVIWLYPYLLIAGAAAAVLTLIGSRPFDGRHIVAAAVLSALLLTPLFSHAIKPRYYVATVTLADLLLPLSLCRPSTVRWLAARAAELRRAIRTPLLPAAAAAVCILVFAGQLGLGRWQTDEFKLFGDFHISGPYALMPRLFYSPRPFSEGLLFLYGNLVNAVGQPLIAMFLALLWTAVIGGGVLAGWCALPPSRFRFATASALVGALFAFVLATADLTEIFYWPMSAAAYLPVAGSAVVLLFLLSRSLDARRRLGCGAALLVAATSSEMGAFLAIGFAAAAAVELITRAPPRRQTMVETLWWVVPALLGLVVMVFIVLVRATGTELGADAQPYTGRPAASLVMTLRQLPLEFVGGTGGGWLLAARLLFGLGFATVWRQADAATATPGRGQAVLAAALIACIGLSILASYYHYGTLCCERHASTRSWLVDLVFVLAACWAAAQWRRLAGVTSRRWVPPLLLAMSLLPILTRIEGIATDYRMQHLALDGGVRTWRSGHAPGDGQMQFYLPPDGFEMLVRGTSVPIGSFEMVADTPELLRNVGRYFGKTVVVTCQPWQNEKSWLLNGQFTPACPPHDGPPDVVWPPSP